MREMKWLFSVGAVLLILSGCGETNAEINADEFEALKPLCEKNDGMHHVIYYTVSYDHDFERPEVLICNDGSRFQVPRSFHKPYRNYSVPKNTLEKDWGNKKQVLEDIKYRYYSHHGVNHQASKD